MSSDIVTLLHLDKTQSSRVVLVKEINHCDSSFVTSCVLGHCIKNKTAVIVVSTHNSLLHYHNVGLKMNYNLQRNIESGLVDFFNLGQYCVESLLLTYKLPPLFNTINEKLLAMKVKHSKVNIIIDGISHLFDMNYSLKEVSAFCRDLIEFVGNHDSFVVFHCNAADDSDVTHVKANFLAHKAHTLLEVESLTSGWSMDVSGHLTVKQPGYKFDIEHMHTLDMKPSHYLFKLFDRGVKLFAPGTV